MTGVRAALLPVSVQQMRASAALWSTWRQAQQSAAQRSASQQTHSSFGSRAPGPYSSAAASSLSSKTPGLTRPAAAQAEGTQLHGLAAQAALNQARLLSDQDAHAAGPSGSRKVEGGRLKQEETRQAKGESKGAHRGGALGVDAEGGPPANRQQDDEGDNKGADGQATNRGGIAGLRPISVADTLAEYWRLRARSGAPHPAWIVGSPAIQVETCTPPNRFSFTTCNSTVLLFVVGVILEKLNMPSLSACIEKEALSCQSELPFKQPR